MRIDVNASWGHWPFRDLRHAQSVAAFVEDRREHGIGETWLTPLEGYFRADPLAETAALRAIFGNVNGVKVVDFVNPTISRGPRSLGRQEEPPPVIRLAPTFHSYTLGSPQAKEALKAAGGGIVLLTVRLNDRRGQPAAFAVPDLSIEAVLETAEAHPDCCFVATGCCLREVVQISEEGGGLSNLCADVALVDGLDAVAQARHRLGERLVFGSNWPLHYTLAAVRKVAGSSLDSKETAGIFAGAEALGKVAPGSNGYLEH
jgi:hypothetical protein